MAHMVTTVYSTVLRTVWIQCVTGSVRQGPVWADVQRPTLGPTAVKVFGKDVHVKMDVIYLCVFCVPCYINI